MRSDAVFLQILKRIKYTKKPTRDNENYITNCLLGTKDTFLINYRMHQRLFTQKACKNLLVICEFNSQFRLVCVDALLSSRVALWIARSPRHTTLTACILF